jgi:hypothetical protein
MRMVRGNFPAQRTSKTLSPHRRRALAHGENQRLQFMNSAAQCLSYQRLTEEKAKMDAQATPALHALAKAIDAGSRFWKKPGMPVPS